jgi:hypothetical protein
MATRNGRRMRCTCSPAQPKTAIGRSGVSSAGPSARCATTTQTESESPNRIRPGRTRTRRTPSAEPSRSGDPPNLWRWSLSPSCTRARGWSIARTRGARAVGAAGAAIPPCWSTARAVRAASVAATPGGGSPGLGSSPWPSGRPGSGIGASASRTRRARAADRQPHAAFLRWLVGSPERGAPWRGRQVALAHTERPLSGVEEEKRLRNRWTMSD